MMVMMIMMMMNDNVALYSDDDVHENDTRHNDSDLG